MYSGRITFEVIEHEEIPGKSNEYYYEHTFLLEVDLEEDYIYERDEFIGCRPVLNIVASHNKTYKRGGKLLQEFDLGEHVELTIPDPQTNRLNAVVESLKELTRRKPWSEKLIGLI
jgi:hypothetical protein